eukprot:GFYU01000506.1.p1 GENE.GFYU01000506.1~~GFYU01000506.1.p1  ORF type:complete len:556 (-),score=171.65 GFYU01000506.1:195-1862(-)
MGTERESDTNAKTRTHSRITPFTSIPHPICHTVHFVTDMDTVVSPQSAMSHLLAGLDQDLLSTSFVILGGIASVALVAFLRDVWKNRSKSAPMGTVPPNEGNPFVTLYLLITNFDQMLEIIVERFADLGPVFEMNLPFKPTFLNISDPACVEHILKTNFDNYPKGKEVHDNMKQFLGRGIFAVDGPEWKRQRKTASHMFQVKNFKENIAQRFNNKAEVLTSVLRRRMENNEPIDMHELFHRYTMDSFGEAGFGVTINSLENDRDSQGFAKAFDQAQYTVQLRFLNPLWRFTQYISPDEYRFRAAIKRLRGFAGRVIEARMKQIEDEGIETVATQYDILSLFLQRGDEDGEPLTKEYLTDIVLNFIIAGRDTTAQALSWCIYLLATHPDEQTALYNEVIKYKSDLTFHTVKDSMPLTEAVVSETIRLYPSVPKDLKIAVNDDVLPNGMRVKAGSYVLYHPYAMGRDTKLWGPDAAEFKPSRWIDQPKPSSYKFSAFQAGPRICLGQQMAFVEAKIALAHIVSKFNISLVPGHKVTYKTSLTLPMKDGLFVSLEPRI